MSVIPAQEIIDRCKRDSLIYPFNERSTAWGLTYGVGPAGYDIRLAEDIVLHPGWFSLGSSLEHFTMPNDLIAFVHDKSTLARMGLDVKNTVIEPGWRGHLTLELTNNWHPDQSYESDLKVLHLKRGQPIAQIIWHKLETFTHLPYNGKYQDQKAGVQEPILEK